MYKSQKTPTSLLLALALSAAAVSAHAGDATSARDYRFELGPVFHTEKFDNYVNGQHFTRQKADMWGLKGSVSRGYGPGVVKLTGEFAIGDSNYTGSYMGGQYGDLRIGGLDRYLLTSAIEYQWGGRDLNGFVVGAGLGQRRLVDRLDQAGAGGYRSVNDRVFVTLSAERPFGHGDWSFTPGVKVHKLVWGQQSYDYAGGIEVDQDNGYGAELALKVTHAKAWQGLTVTPFLRTWDVKTSKSVPFNGGEVTSPANKTKEVGVEVAFVF